MSDPLAAYLHDHLAGAKAAVDLLEAMRDRHQGQPLGEFSAELLSLVEADRDTLQRLADKIGSGSSLLKELGGWAAEKVARLKLGQKSNGDFGTFEALEFLALGIRGKIELWQALDVVSALDARLRGYDFQQLATSAHVQYEMAEEQRLQIATTALAPAN